MGVNANFTADFSTFLSAINAADVAMADFGKGADTVGTKLNNMVDKFSGRALIQQANELVVAVNSVGGATALTTQEQTKLNATLDQAIQKYQAIGEEVPPAMQKLADQTKQVSSGTTDLLGGLKDLAGAFGLAFSADAIVGFVESLFSGAQALRNLSLQTHINIEDLQTLKIATADFGVEGDTLGRALFQLQQRIAGGDQSLTAAYAAMGLSMDQVKAKSNDAMALFLMTEHGLGTLGGALQDVAAKDLFGGRLGASMIAFSTQTDEAIAKAQKLNIATGDSVKAMAENADAVDRAWASMKNWATEVAGGAILGVQTLNKAVADGGSKWSLFVAVMKDYATSLNTGTDSTSHLTAALDQLNQQTAANTAAQQANTQAHKDAAPVLTAEQTARQYMAQLEINNIAPLTAWQKQDLDYLNKKGELDKANIVFLGLTADQLALYKKGLEDAKKASEDLSKQEAAADAIAMAAYTKRAAAINDLTQATLKAYSFEGQIQNLKALEAAEEELARSVYDQTTSEKDRMKIIEDYNTRKQAIEKEIMALEATHSKILSDQVQAELTARQEVLAAQGRNLDGSTGELTALQKYTIALDDLHNKKQAGIDQYYQEQALMLKYQQDALAEANALNTDTTATDSNTTAKKNNAAASAAAASAAAAAAAIPAKAPAPVTPSTPTSSGASGSSSSGFTPGGTIPSSYMLVGTDIWGMSAQAAAAGGRLAWDDFGNPYIYIPGVNAAPKVGSGPGVDLVLNGPGISVSGFAEGGPVSGGTPILVGEKGPELFVPTSSGNIIPNGGGVSVTNYFYVNGTAADVARQVAAELLRTIKSGAQLAH